MIGQWVSQVLLGSTGDRELLKELRELRWGRMWVDRKPTPYEGEPWGFDNGAFTDWKGGKPFDADRFQRRLEAAYAVGRPYLAVCPDIVAGGKRSLDFSLEWMTRLPSDWPWYLAVQDGMRFGDLIPAIDEFSGVFLGGTNAFKLQAIDWRRFADHNGKPFHYARAGTLKKLDHAKRIRSTSLDSCFPLWTRSRFQTFVRHWKDGGPQLALFTDLEDAA